MKTIEDLTGRVVEADYREQRAPAAVVFQRENGVIVHGFFGPGGLEFRSSRWDVESQSLVKTAVAMPMGAIEALLQEHAPELFMAGDARPTRAAVTRARLAKARTERAAVNAQVMKAKKR